MLTRDQILSAHDMSIERIYVDAWGGTVCVRMLSGRERDRFEQWVSSSGGQPRDNIRARLASITICDEAGARVFSDDDVLALGDKSSAALDIVCAAAMRINRLDGNAIETAKKN